MTIRGLFREFVIAKEQIKRERDRDRWMAWHIAAFMRAKQLPQFHEVLRTGARQTPEEQAAMWAYIGDTMGTRRPHKKRRGRIVRSYGKQLHRRHT